MENPPSYKKLVDYESLMKLLAVSSIEELRILRRRWVEEKISQKQMGRESQWTESIAIGSREFLEKIKKGYEDRTAWKEIVSINGSDSFQLRDTGGNYYVFWVKKHRFS